MSFLPSLKGKYSTTKQPKSKREEEIQRGHNATQSYHFAE
jgi:hypothetical protein